MRIGIVGGGISGLTAGYLLSKDHEIVLYEAEDYPGGHTHTVDVELEGISYAVDTGFIVYNEATYPNFVQLLDSLGVASQPSDMSFSVSCDRSGLEYSAPSLQSVFAQRRNLIRLSFYRMLLDIVRFNARAKHFLATEADARKALRQFFEEVRLSEDFLNYYLVPMMSAIWSADPAQIRDLPAAYFLQFFNNHGLLNLYDRPEWRVVQGGSREYVGPLTKGFREGIRLNTPVETIRRFSDRVEITDKTGRMDVFDHVIIAVHSDQALRMLECPTKAERAILGAIPYQRNDVVLHTDDSLLPRNKKACASWNYRIREHEDHQATLTYNMSRLQSIEAPVTFCVTLNQREDIDPGKILADFKYSHPVYNEKTVEAQRLHGDISGWNRTHYCGAYWGFGFHEDGVKSALAACSYFGKDRIQ